MSVILSVGQLLNATVNDCEIKTNGIYKFIYKDYFERIEVDLECEG